MSDKTEKLAESALDGKSAPSDTVILSVPQIGLKRYSSLISCQLSIFSSNVAVQSYPDSVTDQTHRASISEQIRQGQGSAESAENSKEFYDFPDGKDDGSRGVGVFDLSEPSEVFEKEASFKRQIASELSLSQQADRAQKNAVERAKKASESKTSTEAQKSSQNQSSSVSDAKTE